SPLRLDVTSTDSIDAAVRELEHQGRVPHVVVNNAGVSVRNSALDATTGEFDLTLAVNLRGTYFVAQRAARTMRGHGGGRIVNLASIGGLVVDGEQSSVYDASKAAVVQLTRNLAYEWGRYGIRVNAIAPGYMRTEMTAELLPSREVEDELVARHIPLGRVGEPEDLAGAVVFLASAASAYVTGHTLTVDGGWVVSL
ncbi:MAG TPA: SDR family oxidoreductase, partial [Micromonospora sp.]